MPSIKAVVIQFLKCVLKSKEIRNVLHQPRVNASKNSSPVAKRNLSDVIYVNFKNW